MTKKFLYVAALLFALACILVSCGHEHAFGEWTVVAEATCISAGVEERVCECGEKQTYIEDAIGHIESDWMVDLAPTCTEQGNKHKVCTVCGAITDTKVMAAEGHQPTSYWAIAQESTCVSAGIKIRKCKACDEIVESKTAPLLEHSLTISLISKATAESKAKITYSCSNCSHCVSEEVEPISISVKVSSGFTIINNFNGPFASFEVTANGGYGEYLYKYEWQDKMQDFSKKDSIELLGNAFSDPSSATVIITVMDEIGQKSVYVTRGNTCLDKYVVYE